MGQCGSTEPVTQLIDTLVHVPLFSALGDPALRALAAQFRSIHVLAGEVIFREGDQGDSYFVIQEGSVAVTALGKNGELQHLAEWYAPHSFGEIALLRDGSKRTATVVAKEDSMLLVLTKRRFNRLASKPWMDTIRARMQTLANHRMSLFLKEISFLSKIDDAQLEVLGSLFTYERTPRGCAVTCSRWLAQGVTPVPHPPPARTTIVRENQPADAFYIISRGRASVTTAGEVEGAGEGAWSGRVACPSQLAGPNGEEVLLGDLDEGSYFGEMALLANTPRTATVTATDTCMLLVLQRKEFRNFLKMVPNAREHLEVLMRQRAVTNLRDLDVPLFRGMQESQLQMLGKLCESVTFKKGTLIALQGLEGDAFYVVTNGHADVYEQGTTAPDGITRGASDAQAAAAVLNAQLARSRPLSMVARRQKDTSALGTRVCRLKPGDFFVRRARSPRRAGPPPARGARARSACCWGPREQRQSSPAGTAPCCASERLRSSSCL